MLYHDMVRVMRAIIRQIFTSMTIANEVEDSEAQRQCYRDYRDGMPDTGVEFTLRFEEWGLVAELRWMPAIDPSFSRCMGCGKFSAAVLSEDFCTGCFGFYMHGIEPPLSDDEWWREFGDDH